MKKYWVLLFILVLLLGGLVFRNYKSNDIERNKIEAIGEIYRIRHVARKINKRIYEYEFVHNGEKYKGEIRGYLKKNKNVIEGNYYKVEFSKTNPNNNKIIFEEQYSVDV